MIRLAAFFRRLADRIIDSHQRGHRRRCEQARPDPELVAGLERESQPFAPTLTIADRVLIRKSLLPNDIQADPYLLEIETIRLEQEIEAEYGECADSRKLRADIEKAHRLTTYERKLNGLRVVR